LNSCFNSSPAKLAFLPNFSGVHPAALLGILIVAGCNDSSAPTTAAESLCRAQATSISTLQGDGYSSPLAGSESTVRGVVTHVAEGDGFYIEGPGEYQPSSSSKAMFVADEALSQAVRKGQQLALRGRVSELGAAKDKLTSLVDLTGHEICAGDQELPLTRARLPLNAARREALEGMRVVLEQQLKLTDVYNLFRGELTLSSNEVLRVPTEIRPPGSAAEKAASENRAHSIAAVLPPSQFQTLPVGTVVTGIRGVMGHDGKQQQLLLDSPLVGERPPADTLGPPAGGAVRIVSFNLLNFFNGDGKGSGFPTERGAATLEEFHSQRERTKAAITKMQPDLLAVQELENDGFGAHGAARALLDLLNETGHGDWAVVDPGIGKIGGDVITVGLFYRQDVLERTGSAHVLDGPEFKRLSRRPLAQMFRHLSSGKLVLVAVNHLKSKGRCPEEGENADQNDGQGCWNAARLAAVKAQLPWLEKLAEEKGTEHIIILGDMNAWRNEDPIRGFTRAGYLDLVEQTSGLPQHSFLYWGQTGTLDYAFVSVALGEYTRRAEIWNVNARWPRNMEPPQPWLRASDHDPVIVDFDFTQSATSD